MKIEKGKMSWYLPDQTFSCSTEAIPASYRQQLRTLRFQLEIFLDVIIIEPKLINYRPEAHPISKSVE
jgi:hypothetical protein